MTLLVAIPSEPEARTLTPAVPEGVRTLVCGVGVVASALAVAEALDGAVSAVLLVGVAGTRDKTKAGLCDVVECTSVVNEAVGAGSGASFTALGALGIAGVPADGDRLACSYLHDILPLNSPLIGVHGVCGTVAAASASRDEAEAWRALHPDVVLEEMEGWGVATACRRAGVPFASLRAISNVAGERDRRAWDLPGALAALRDVLDASLPRETSR